MRVEFSNGFTRDISRIRNQSIRERIEKAILKNYVPVETISAYESATIDLAFYWKMIP